MKMTGAEIVVACLREQGVDTVFGYPGGAILNVYDALYKHSDEIRHILSSHEQGASHMADGYARATGKVGVCLATSGPGATNLVTGIATAYMDSVPMVAITCNVTLPLLGKDSFQEVDIAGITMPITKHGYIVKDVKDLADRIRKAFRIASTGRPGPVLVDIPKDVTAAVTDYVPLSHTRRLVGEGRRYSVMGKGAYDGHEAHYTGMIGMHGTKTSNLGVSKCDLLIAMGARFTDRVIGNPNKFAENAKIIHIDIDPAEINKNIKVNFSVIGNLKDVLHDLNAKLSPMHHEEWMKQIREMKAKYPLFYDKSKLTCPMVIEKLDKLTKGDAVIVTDVGQHQMWAAQYYTFSKPRTLLSSGGLGTMGYGLGAAIGAKVAFPKRQVINIAGDGCFRMNMNELATASRYNIPIIEIVIDNRVLGMVRQWQTLYYGERYSATVIEDKVDYCKVAEGLGCLAIRVTEPSEVEPAIKKALSAGVPTLIDVVINEDDKVFPMVSPGAPIEKAFDASDLESQNHN